MGEMQRRTDGLRHASSETLRLQARECLERLLQHATALRFACLGTADGRLLASVDADARSTGERIAAMTSSLLALSESFAKDALRSHCNYSVVATEHGSIVVVRVPHVGRGYMLSVGSDGSELMALTLRAALDAAERLAVIIADASAAAA
jgi:predicted regulator of Ras-like GTPase activity (Roadblock/LC7/MglB family)